MSTFGLFVMVTGIALIYWAMGGGKLNVLGGAPKSGSVPGDRAGLPGSGVAGPRNDLAGQPGSGVAGPAVPAP